MYTPPYQIILKISDGQKIFSQLFLNFMRVLLGFLNRIETLQRGKVRYNPNRDQPHGKRTPSTRLIICHCCRAKLRSLLCISLLADLYTCELKKP